MYLLRRTAARAIVSSPSRAVFVKPRSITTITASTLRSTKNQWLAPAFQRRFASDEVTKSDTADAAALEAESFAQTAPEAPVEDNLTPAQQSVQAEPTDSSSTVGPDALEAAAANAGRGASRGRSNGGNADPNKVLYVGNLFYQVSEDQLKRVFSRFGPIESVKMVKDNRGMSRGFAYVEFQNIADSQAAVDNLDMQVFEGRNLVVQPHRPKSDGRSDRSDRTGGRSSFEPHPPSKTLFIGNMSFEMSDKDLNDLFRDIRNVMDVRVAIDRRTGQPRGFAHADFIDVASATKAKEILSDKVIYGRALRIDFSKSGSSMQRDQRQSDREPRAE